MRMVPRERCFTYYSLRWAALQGYDDSLAPRSEPLGPQARDSEGRRARRRHNFAKSVCCDRPPPDPGTRRGSPSRRPMGRPFCRLQSYRHLVDPRPALHASVMLRTRGSAKRFPSICDSAKSRFWHRSSCSGSTLPSYGLNPNAPKRLGDIFDSPNRTPGQIHRKRYELPRLRGRLRCGRRRVERSSNGNVRCSRKSVLRRMQAYFWKVCSEMSSARPVGCARRRLAIPAHGGSRRFCVVETGTLMPCAISCTTMSSSIWRMTMRCW
ncbi:hypothetical protein ACVWXQ_000153 [Bradyrhizobium sp. S3.14.4]